MKNNNRTKISDDGRETFLVWQWVEHANINGWVVGHIADNAGYYGKPKLYKTHMNKVSGGLYVIVSGRRVYVAE